jgi:rRNA processing protein Krr1/Pno1
MADEQSIRLPMERVGVLVGKDGNIKSEIERRCGVLLEVRLERLEFLTRSQNSKSRTLSKHLIL